MGTIDLNKTGPPLRPYQEDVIHKMILYDGHSALCVLGTGLGKTRIFVDFLRREVTENDHHCLILSHREELVRQPLTYLSDLPCGIELAQQHARGQPVISASVQSLVRRLDRYNPREIDTIIVDEAHHAAAPTYRKVLDYFPAARIFGFTATAHRGDGIGLDCVFDDLLCEYDTLWGINHGYLTPMDCVQVQLKYKMGAVKINEYGDYDQTDVARIMSGTAAGVVEAYEKHARGQTIIFAVSVDEARDIADLLNKHAGKRVAGLILGSTRDRGRVLEAYKLGILRVLVNYGVLTEGTDLPSTETVIIARPISHTNVGLYAQMVGRALRLYPGKTTALVVDCVGISDYPVCTAATLIGKHLKNADKNNTEASIPVENAVENVPITILSGDDIPESWIDKRREVSILDKGKGVDLHGVAWIHLKNGGYVLRVPNMVYRISAPDQNGCVYLRKNKKSAKSPMPPQFVLDYVYQDLCKNHPHDKHIWDAKKRRIWDNQPATDAQVALIQKLNKDCNIDIHKMTRGDASGLIQTLLYCRGDL